jgi:hypothetical protein
MRRIRIPFGCLLLGPGLLLAGAASGQTTYTDALNDNYGGPEVDISSVVISNDANNINFTMNLNSTASIGPTANRFADYEFGIQENGGVGGQTEINGNFTSGDPTAGNPYGNAVGISTGENYFIGNFLAGTTFSGGSQLYSYSSTAGWTQVGATATLNQVNSGSPSLSFSFPLSALGLTVGSSFNFDAWTTFGSPQAAYDALDNDGTGSANAPFTAGTTYDSATAPGSVLATYTVTASVPEPASMAILGGAGLLMMRRRRA